MSSTNKTMFKTPIAGAAKRIFNDVANGSIAARVTKNTRTIASFPSPAAATQETNTVHNYRNNATKPIHLPATTTHRNVTAKNVAYNNIYRRSMVTITQTKSSDLAPLFGTHVVDDVTPASSSSAPIYLLNEDTTLLVTESCLKQIETLLKQRRVREDQPENHDDGYFLRVFVDAGGCSGFQYQFEVDNELEEDDDVVVVMAKVEEVSRPRVVVDETSMGFLEGSTIDYVIEMIKSAFVISDNPQSESACGCGSSFAMKNFEKFEAKD